MESVAADTPRPEPRVVVTIRLRRESRSKINALAARRGETPSATIRALLAYGVDAMPVSFGRLG